MKTIAVYTLGCKVNQYDTQAMLELFLEDGYSQVAFHEKADLYLVNTCVVTGVGEQKSRQMLRRALKQNPEASLIVAGCLAQKEAEALLQEGARLIIGSQHRARVVQLLKEAENRQCGLAMVDKLSQVPFEALKVSRHEGKTRAVLKIQEGCDRYCAYCIIPYVRGNLRSRPIDEIRNEACRLVQNGYRELVLTGIHLSSYGRDLNGPNLADAISAAAESGADRLRLGSLEPVAVTDSFVKAISGVQNLCPHFHLSLQSGSDSVLMRMKRRYNCSDYRMAVARLREAFPDCSLSTDVMLGFPGESEEEFAESLRFCEEIGFYKLHVFPYSRREGTVAAKMSQQIPQRIKTARARQISELGQALNANYLSKFQGKVLPVLFEEVKDGISFGLSPEHIPVYAKGAEKHQIYEIQLDTPYGDGLWGTIFQTSGGAVHG